MTRSRAELVRHLGGPSLALAVLLGLTGCSGGSGPDTGGPTAGATASTTTTTMVTAPPPGPDDGHTTTDVEYAQIMVSHHAQALWMSTTLLGKQGIDQRVRAVAEQIRSVNPPQITQLTRWLEAWQSTVPPTTASGVHEADQGRLNLGMVTQQQMDDLKGAKGAEAARLFLNAMIRHHQGGVSMADSEAFGGSYPLTKALAQQIGAEQRDRLTTMQQVLSSL